MGDGLHRGRGHCVFIHDNPNTRKDTPARILIPNVENYEGIFRHQARGLFAMSLSYEKSVCLSLQQQRWNETNFLGLELPMRQADAANFQQHRTQVSDTPGNPPLADDRERLNRDLV